MKNSIIFDMDGTLWDSTTQILDSWNLTFSRMPDLDVHLTQQQLQAEMGKTMDNIAVSVMPMVSRERAIEVMTICGQEENEYIRQHGATLYPELLPVLEELRKEYRLFIVSNCQSGYIESFLEYYQLADYFEDLECYGNTLEGKGANIRRLMKRNQIEHAIYVGDTQGDYNACMEADIPFVWASYGFGSVDACVPEIKGLSELSGLLSELFAEVSLQDKKDPCRKRSIIAG